MYELGTLSITRPLQRFVRRLPGVAMGWQLSCHLTSRNQVSNCFRQGPRLAALTLRHVSATRTLAETRARGSETAYRPRSIVKCARRSTFVYPAASSATIELLTIGQGAALSKHWPQYISAHRRRISRCAAEVACSFRSSRRIDASPALKPLRGVLKFSDRYKSSRLPTGSDHLGCRFAVTAV